VTELGATREPGRDAGLAKKLFIKTFGCQMNVYDSARMADVLAPLGYAPAAGPEAAADQAAWHDRHVVGVADPRSRREPGERAVELDLGRDADDDRAAQRVLRKRALHLRCGGGREAGDGREGGGEAKHGWVRAGRDARRSGAAARARDIFACDTA